MNKKLFKLTYTLYRYDYIPYMFDEMVLPKEITVITEEPLLYIDRIKSDLAMNNSEMVVGTYHITPISHLTRVK